MAKPLPHNIEAEKIILGAMMTNANALAQCINSVSVDHFYGQASPHQVIYQAIRNLFDKRLPVDIQTVLEELGLMKEAVNAGGIDYLKELLDAVISLSNLDFYLVILQDNKLLRDYLTTIDKIRQSYDTEEIDEINAFLSRAENDLRLVSERRRIDKFKTAYEVSQRVEAELKIFQRADGLTGVDVGYKKINDYTHGLQKGEMTIIAARPSVGKTAFALNVAYNAVKLNPISVAVFSLEMHSEKLVRRIIATDSKISLDN
ncbi:MAG: DnaB-like helicase N-terminal domain-containing protein, partial [Bacilli bacterium]